MAINHLDVAALTETWIPSDAPAAIKLDIVPSGYRAIHVARGMAAEKGGAGVGFIYRESVRLSVIDIGQYGTFEHAAVKIVEQASSTIIVCIYRTPGSVSIMFCSDLSNLFDELLVLGSRLLVCGDLSCPGADHQIDTHLADLLVRHNLIQHVRGSTHEKGNLLDLLITRESDVNLVNNVSLQSLCFTDQYLVKCRLMSVQRPRPVVVSYGCRRLRNIEGAAFQRDVLQSKLFDPVTDLFTADQYADLLQSEVVRLLDVHAPLIRKTKRQGATDCRILSDEAREAKRVCRRLERRYRRTLSVGDGMLFRQARTAARKKIAESRSG